MNGHPQDALLDYAYGELAAEETRALEAHLGGCEACRKELAQIRGVRKAMAQLAPEPAPQAGLDSLLAYAEKAAARAKADTPRSGLRWLWPLVGALAALCVVVVISDRNLRAQAPSVALGTHAKAYEKNEASFGSLAPQAQAEAKLARNDLAIAPAPASAAAPIEPRREHAQAAKKAKQLAAASGALALERGQAGGLAGEPQLEKSKRTLELKEQRIVAVLEPRPAQAERPPPGLAQPIALNLRAGPSAPPPPPAAPSRRAGGSIAKIDSFGSSAPAAKEIAEPERAATRGKASSVARADRFQPSTPEVSNAESGSAASSVGGSIALADEVGQNAPKDRRSAKGAEATSAAASMAGSIAMAERAEATKARRSAESDEAASAAPSPDGQVAMAERPERSASKPRPPAAPVDAVSSVSSTGGPLAMAERVEPSASKPRPPAAPAEVANAASSMSGQVAMADRAGQISPEEQGSASPGGAGASPDLVGAVAMEERTEPKPSAEATPADMEDAAPRTRAQPAAKREHRRSSTAAPAPVARAGLGEGAGMLGAGSGLGTAAAATAGGGSAGSAANEAEQQPAAGASRRALLHERARIKSALAHAADGDAPRLLESLCEVDLALGRHDWAGADCGQLVRRFPESAAASRARSMLHPPAKPAAAENSQ